MKLRSVYFSGLVCIPGTSSRQDIFHVDDGWNIERLPDGQLRFQRDERTNEPARQFVASGQGYTYEPLPPQAPPVLVDSGLRIDGENGPIPVLTTKRRKKVA